MATSKKLSHHCGGGQATLGMVTAIGTVIPCTIPTAAPKFGTTTSSRRMWTDLT